MKYTLSPPSQIMVLTQYGELEFENYQKNEGKMMQNTTLEKNRIQWGKFSCNKRSPKDASGKRKTFCIRNFSKRKRAKQRKQMQGGVFLFHWKRYAKIQALLRKKQNHLRSSFSMVLQSPISKLLLSYPRL